MQRLLHSGIKVCLYICQAHRETEREVAAALFHVCQGGVRVEHLKNNLIVSLVTLCVCVCVHMCMCACAPVCGVFQSASLYSTRACVRTVHSMLHCPLGGCFSGRCTVVLTGVLICKQGQDKCMCHSPPHGISTS